MSKTRGKDISSYNSNSYLLTVLISSARKMRKSDCCFRSSFFSVQATSRPLNIWWGGWFCTKNTIFVLEVRQKKKDYLLLLQTPGREPFSPLCLQRGLLRIPNLLQSQTSGSLLKAVMVSLVTQQVYLQDIGFEQALKARAGLFFSLIMVLSSLVSNISKHIFAGSH